MSEHQAKVPAAGRDVLNIGCGPKKLAGAVNVDIRPWTQPDVLHDLDVRPWPFEDGTFREVIIHDVLEHLKDPVATIVEVHRVCQPGAVVRVTVPHFSSANAFSDPTHRGFFSTASFDFLAGVRGGLLPPSVRFRVRTRRIIFYPSLSGRLWGRLANHAPEAYERRWAWMFPAWFLYAELEVEERRGSSPA